MARRFAVAAAAHAMVQSKSSSPSSWIHSTAYSPHSPCADPPPRKAPIRRFVTGKRQSTIRPMPADLPPLKTRFSPRLARALFMSVLMHRSKRLWGRAGWALQGSFPLPCTDAF